MRQAIARVPRPVILFAGLCVLGPAGATQGQTPASGARLQGVVVDAETLEPIDSATVSLPGTNTRVVTQRWGTFEFPDAPLGALTVHATAPGYSSVAMDVEVREDGAAYVHMVLPTMALTLSELLVQAQGGQNRPQVARTAAELLAQVVPRLSVNSGTIGQSDFDLNLRQATSFTGPSAPTVVVDGVVLSRGPAAFDALERIPATDVEAVEVLRGPSAAFLYPFAANGVILVTTKRGQGR
jgi:outer membrane receptor protein involved in Fe transport